MKTLRLFAFSTLAALSASAQLVIAPSVPEVAPDASPVVEDSSSRPWYAFWRKSPADAEATAEALSGDDFPAPADTPAPLAPEEPCWRIEFADGSSQTVLVSSLSFKIDALPEAIPFSADRFSMLQIERAPLFSDEPGTVYALLRGPVPVAISAPLPRTLHARAADGSRISVPWSSVSALRDPDVVHSPDRTYRYSLPITVSYPDGLAPETPPPSFPVAFIPFKSERASFSIPSWLLSSISVNPDRTVTLRSVYGDVLTGTIPPLKRFTGFENATSIIFKSSRRAPEAPDAANQYRLATGDVLVAVPVSTPEAAPARASLRTSAAPVSAPAAPHLLSPLLDPSATLVFPADAVEAVAPCTATLPPASTRPWSASARATDEILVPAGAFHLGCAAPNAPRDESPSINVPVDPFYLAATPVTVAQFAAFVADTSYRPHADARSWDSPGFPQTPNDPVVAVSWRDAATYCNWLSKKARLTPAYTIPSDDRLPVTLDITADGWRLPFEAEWEYAARDLGKPISFPWGDDTDETEALARANFAPSPAASAPRPYPFTSPVKSFPASPSGFYDLAGNVFEWCQDVYAADAYSTFYAAGDISSLINPPTPSFRVIRGGSYLSPLRALRNTARAYGLETAGASTVGTPRVGFRPARNAP